MNHSSTTTSTSTTTTNNNNIIIIIDDNNDDDDINGIDNHISIAIRPQPGAAGGGAHRRGGHDRTRLTSTLL